MAQKYINQALGLHTFKNELTVPDGAMQKADNVVIDRDGIVESRRGFGLYADFGTSSSRASQLLQYKDKLLLHYADKLLFENNGVFQQFSGSFESLEDGLRIKGLENKGNFYFTTKDGIKKISASNSSQFTTNSGYITNAGVVRGLDFTLKCNYTTTGFFNPNSVVAYRIVWGYKDKNNNLLLGYPSAINVIRNVDSVESCTVDLSITIPSEIVVTNNSLRYFYQVYRSNLKTPYDNEADVEFKMVMEDFPTEGQISAGFVNITDIMADDYRNTGADLYTNEVSGEGEAQANSRPPLAADLAHFKGSVFYANTKTIHNKTINLFSVDYYTSGVTKFYIASEAGVQAYTFVGVKEKSEINFTAMSDANVNTLDGKYFLLSAANNIRQYFVWYDYTGSTITPSNSETVGKIGIKIDISGSTTVAQVVTATINELEPMVDFGSDNNGDPKKLYIENEENGNCDDINGVTLASLGNGIVFTKLTEGDGEDIPNKEALWSVDPSTGVKLEETAKSLIRVVNANTSEVVNAFYLSTVIDLPGQISFQSKSAEDIPFYVATNDATVASDFNPSIPVVQTSLTSSLVGQTVTINWTGHGLNPGDPVILFNPIGLTSGVINGVYTIVSTPTSDSFTVTISGLVGSLSTLDAFKGTEGSDNEEKPNRVYFSKNEMAESVPTPNYFDIGSQDSAIKRIIPLRDSLFVLKDEGVYRISGTDAANFTNVLFDESSPIIAPDSAAVLNNQIFMLSKQGVVTVSDTGVDIMSRNIERDILYPTSNNFPDFSIQSFGISSESDRSYFLFLPTKTDDAVATQCFRYNVFTRAWTRWPISKTCGIVKKFDDKIYFGAADTNYIEQERKNFMRSDYADRDYPNTILSILNGTTVELSAFQNVGEFDALYQEQYITISRFNRLLSRLDSDPFLSFGQYESTYFASVGADLGSLLAALITKVDTDDNTQGYTPYNSSNDIVDLVNGFNLFMAELNVSTGLFYSNYRYYTDLVRYETIVTNVNKFSNRLEAYKQVPFVVGDCKIFKAIDSFVEYAPETLGDGSLGKQFREATMMFDQLNFTFGYLGFRSDVYASITSQLMIGEGNGDYGSQVYGEEVYGGLANERPFRTYVPRNHQRCRHIILSFRHIAARENFGLNGYSLTYNESTSTRFYKR